MELKFKDENKIEAYKARTLNMETELRNLLIDFNKEVESLIIKLSYFNWISVTDRLPEPDVEVLLYAENCTHALHGEYKDIFGDGNYKFIGHCVEIKNVTHWLPLPEPPNERE